MRFKEHLKEFWKLNKKDYLIVVIMFTLFGAFLIMINGHELKTYLIFPIFYVFMFLLGFSISFLDEDIKMSRKEDTKK